MKRIKRIVGLFVAAMFMLGGLSIHAQAEENLVSERGEWDNLYWKLEEGVLTISGEGDMTSCWEVTDYPWYDYRSQISTIIIEEGVTSMGFGAFYGSAVERVTIPEGICSIGDSAFLYCAKLVEVNLPDSMRLFESGAFAGCTSLSDSMIQEMLMNVEEIASSTFLGCESLTSLTIPENVMRIGSSAFARCENLAEIKVEPMRDNLWVENNILYEKLLVNDVVEINLKVAAPLGIASSVVIPEGVTSIESRAFEECNNLNEISIPNSVTKIGESAFEGCKALHLINMGEGVNVIGTRGFARCSNLTEIMIPRSVVSIGMFAFYATGITDITIPKEVTIILSKALGYRTYSDVIDDYIIRGYAGTVAEEYARSNNITFIVLEEEATGILEVNLSLSSLVDTDDEVVVKLIGDAGETVTTVLGEDTSCQFSDISAGAYTLEVSKKNYVTRNYTVNVGSENIQQDVELQLIGDITGDGTINARDKKLIYNHMAGTSTLTNYIFLVGDVTNDGTINARDKKLIYNHIAGASFLWE